MRDIFTNEYNNQRDDEGNSWDFYIHNSTPSIYHGRNGRYVKPVRYPTKISDRISEEKYNEIRDFHKKVNNIVLEEYKKITS